MSFAAVLERLQRVENPYPGLRPFEIGEAHLFYGRDPQITDLTARIERHRFLAVVGMSGVGKSSLVRAGLIPALKRGGRWRIVMMRPQGAPYSNLAKALDAPESLLRKSSFGLLNALGKGHERMLLVVDQFEELFRYKEQRSLDEAGRARAEDDAAEFVQLLLTTSREPGPTSVVITLRSDYLGQCAEIRDLPETLNDCQYLVPRLSREQRREAIEGPLGRIRISPVLVQQLLNEVGDEPDRLPVLQHALMRTWNHWKRAGMEAREIDLDDYKKAGGITGALDQHAEELLSGVPEPLARTIFQRLTACGLGERERRDPARVAELYKLCQAETPEQRAVVRSTLDCFRLGEATFLTPREGELRDEVYIDITHESLMRHWGKLRDEWMPAEHEAARTFIRLNDQAARWRRGAPVLMGLDLTDAKAGLASRNQSPVWAAHYADEGAFEEVLALINASEQAARELVTNQRIFLDTKELLSALKDAETGQRGFLLTGREYYLDPYRQALADVPSFLSRLEGLTKSCPKQAHWLEEMKPLVQEKLAELDQTIKLRRSQGHHAALAVVMSDQGKTAMDRIRGLCKKMEEIAWPLLPDEWASPSLSES